VKDASLGYHPDTGFWYLTDKRYGLPIFDPKNPSWGVFTTQELHGRVNAKGSKAIADDSVSNNPNPDNAALSWDNFKANFTGAQKQ
jgi:hypothetical protein